MFKLSKKVSTKLIFSALGSTATLGYLNNQQASCDGFPKSQGKYNFYTHIDERLTTRKLYPIKSKELQGLKKLRQDITTEMTATALSVNPELIDSIEVFDTRITIKFVWGFRQDDHLATVSGDMKKNGITNVYVPERLEDRLHDNIFEDRAEINVYDIAKFVNFVEEKNRSCYPKNNDRSSIQSSFRGPAR